MHSYLIGGLRVSSELELAGAIPFRASEPPVDVTIRRRIVPADLDRASATGPTWAMANGRFLLRVPRLARFLMTDGREMAFESEPGVADRDTAVFALGSAFGILLHQRGTLVLHGAAVAKNGRSLAICGASGAGKSTLAAALCEQGYSLLADDVCAVRVSAGRSDTERNGLPAVFPDGRSLKLWQQAIEHLGLSARRGGAVRDAFEKYYIDPPAAHAAPAPLAAIYILQEARLPHEAGIEALELPDAMRALEGAVWRPRLRESIAQPKQALTQVAALLRDAAVFRLIRPRGFELMGETVARLGRHLDQLV